MTTHRTRADLLRQARYVDDNVLLQTDSYKTGHFLQLPPKTQFCYFYIESRGGKWDRTVVFGLQAFIQRYLSRPITQDDIEEAAETFAAHGVPFNREGWEYILRKHDGWLPLLIKAAPEGTVVGTHNVLVTVTNTDPNCAWLPGYLETALIRAVWYPTTVATNSFHGKIALIRAWQKSSDAPIEILDFKLHDFGARAATSHESAALGGMAHMVNFKGSDTVEGLKPARVFYGEPMAAYSIVAAEHSTITAWGRAGELDAYRNILHRFAKPGSLVAIVSDSYDLMHVVENVWGGSLKQDILNSGACIIVRPDSGDPLTVPVEVLHSLAASFGYTVNSKGYKVLPDCIRVIQGDGITAETLPVLLDNILAAGFAIDNIAFGMGGGLLQLVNRDTQRFAMKMAAISIDGVWHDVYKAPKADAGKRSKSGRFALVQTDEDIYETVPLTGRENDDHLHAVFQDGDQPNIVQFPMVRARAHKAAMRLAA